MSSRAQYRDRYGRWAKRGAIVIPPAPRRRDARGRFAGGGRARFREWSPEPGHWALEIQILDADAIEFTIEKGDQNAAVIALLTSELPLAFAQLSVHPYSYGVSLLRYDLTDEDDNILSRNNYVGTRYRNRETLSHAALILIREMLSGLYRSPMRGMRYLDYAIFQALEIHVHAETDTSSTALTKELNAADIAMLAVNTKSAPARRKRSIRH